MNVLVVLLLYLFTQAVYATLTETDMVRIREEQRQMRSAVMEALGPELQRDVTVAEDGQLMRYRFADPRSVRQRRCHSEGGGEGDFIQDGERLPIQCGHFLPHSGGGTYR